MILFLVNSLLKNTVQSQNGIDCMLVPCMKILATRYQLNVLSLIIFVSRMAFSIYFIHFRPSRCIFCGCKEFKIIFSLFHMLYTVNFLWQISSTTDDKENKGDPSSLTSSTNATSPTSKTTGTTDSTYPKDSKETGASNRDAPREVRESAGASKDGRDRERAGSRDRDRRDSWRDERSRDGIRDARDIIREREKDRGGSDTKDGRGEARESKGDTREVREPRDRNDFRDRDRDFRRRRTRSRSFSPRRRDL